MAIVQFRVDDDLKMQATSVYEKLGIDLSTALRMFMKRSVLENGIPFTMVLSNEPYDASKAIDAMRSMQRKSEENGNSEMTLDEINEEIRLARLERKKRK
ncbi:MAG: type II toxin-antitoxin system RelB/DinJ family antitoxin [Bacilli bacterium]|nr:type II toxin-antitoxin system RelB/DinJ family antitoxin [Bacilli bacterium]